MKYGITRDLLEPLGESGRCGGVQEADQDLRGLAVGERVVNMYFCRAQKIEFNKQISIQGPELQATCLFRDPCLL